MMKGERAFRTFLLFFILSGALCTPVHLRAGGEKEKAVTELEFWHPIGAHNKTILQRLISSYNDLNPDVPVKAVFQGSERDLYLKLISSESPPDLVLLPAHYVPALRDKDFIRNLSLSIPPELRSDIAEKYWDPVSAGNEIYGIPFSYRCYLLYVNQHILRISGTRNETEPSSWEELLLMLRRIRENTKDVWPLFIPTENLEQFDAFTSAYAGFRLDVEPLSVDSDPAVQSLRFLKDLVFENGFMPPKVTREEAEQMFLSGRLGMMMAPSSMLVYTQSTLPYNFTVWRLPGSGEPLIAGLSLCVTSQQGDGPVYGFIEHLLSYENSIKWHTNTGDPSVRTSAKGSLDLLIFYEENPNYTTPVIEVERGRPLSSIDGYFEIDAIVARALQKAMIGEEDPETVLKEAQSLIEAGL